MDKQFEIETKSFDDNIQVHFREIRASNPLNTFLDVILLVRLDRAEYSIECFEVNSGSKNKEEISRLHRIKVEGPWTLKKLESDVLKIVRKEFKIFKRQYYPF